MMTINIKLHVQVSGQERESSVNKGAMLWDVRGEHVKRMGIRLIVFETGGRLKLAMGKTRKGD